jgi:hypothetical protein
MLNSFRNDDIRTARENLRLTIDEALVYGIFDQEDHRDINNHIDLMIQDNHMTLENLVEKNNELKEDIHRVKQNQRINQRIWNQWEMDPLQGYIVSNNQQLELHQAPQESSQLFGGPSIDTIPIHQPPQPPPPAPAAGANARATFDSFFTDDF